MKIGDVFEIPCKRGLAYAQFSHRNAREGELIRVLPGTYESRPTDLSALVQQKERYYVFFPVQAAVTRSIFSVVGNAPVPDAAVPFPLFRARGMIDRSGKVLDWWLWDGEKEWRIGTLSPEQRLLPIRSAWNDTLLVERVDSGWTPETDPQTLRSS